MSRTPKKRAISGRWLLSCATGKPSSRDEEVAADERHQAEHDAHHAHREDDGESREASDEVQHRALELVDARYSGRHVAGAFEHHQYRFGGRGRSKNRGSRNFRHPVDAGVAISTGGRR